MLTMAINYNNYQPLKVFEIIQGRLLGYPHNMTFVLEPFISVTKKSGQMCLQMRSGKHRFYYSGRFRAILTYFPHISSLFHKKNSHFSIISVFYLFLTSQ